MATIEELADLKYLIDSGKATELDKKRYRVLLEINCMDTNILEQEIENELQKINSSIVKKDRV